MTFRLTIYFSEGLERVNNDSLEEFYYSVEEMKLDTDVLEEINICLTWSCSNLNHTVICAYKPYHVVICQCKINREISHGWNYLLQELSRFSIRAGIKTCTGLKFSLLKENLNSLFWITTPPPFPSWIKITFSISLRVLTYSGKYRPYFQNVGCMQSFSKHSLVVHNLWLKHQFKQE